MACNCNAINYDCGGPNVSSHCVKWRGAVYAALGICKGDSLTFVVETIIDQILLLLQGVETNPDVDLSTCPAIQTALAGKDPTLDNLLQVLINRDCTLVELIEEVRDSIPTTDPYAFTLQCITPVGAPSNPNAIIQGLINKVCALEVIVDGLGTSVDQIINTEVGNYIGTNIQSLGNRGIRKSGSGSSTVLTFLALVPPLCPIAYTGPLSNFDANGKGMAGTSYEDWYLLSGIAGLPDWRGRVPVASVAGVPGGPLDAAVDPANPLNPGTNYVNGVKFGENFHRNTIQEIPSHVHTVNDPGHVHGMPDYVMFADVAVEGGIGGSPDWQLKNATTKSAQTGITINAAGGGDIHENRQPSIAITGWIMRLN